MKSDFKNIPSGHWDHCQSSRQYHEWSRRYGKGVLGKGVVAMIFLQNCYDTLRYDPSSVHLHDLILQTSGIIRPKMVQHRRPEPQIS